MNPRVPRFISTCLCLFFLAFHISCSTRKAPDIAALKAALLYQMSDPNEEPGAARRYYLEKRVGADGEPAGLVREYRRALVKMDRMPRYSIRTRRVLPSLQEMRRSQMLRKGLQKELLFTWESLGPGNIGGRTRALVLDPRSPEIMYGAGVSGGIWKTEQPVPESGGTPTLGKAGIEFSMHRT